DLPGELGHLVALPEEQRLREVARARAARLVAQPSERTSDEADLKDPREESADGDDRRRRAEDREVAHPDERLLLVARADHLERRRLPRGADAGIDVLPVVVLSAARADDVPGGERSSLVRRQRGTIRRVRGERDDAKRLSGLPRRRRAPHRELDELPRPP